jgi:hypothetical protein
MQTWFVKSDSSWLFDGRAGLIHRSAARIIRFD